MLTSRFDGLFPRLPVRCFGQSLPCTSVQRSRALEVLSADERGRAARFIFDGDRERFVVGRYLVRSSAALYYDCAPIDVPLSIEPGGRVILEAGPHISISHAGKNVVAAFCDAAPVGIDVELAREPGSSDLAALILDAREEAMHLRMTPLARADFLGWVWSRKEAVLKALGEGFSRDPRSINVLDERVALVGAYANAEVRSARDGDYHYSAAVLQT